MIRPIFIYGEPELKLKSETVADFNDPLLRQLISDMFETMLNANGAGLAAPQIGINKRIFVANLPGNEKTPMHFFINPEIKFLSNNIISAQEGCLSIPGIYGNVSRPAAINLNWQDITGEKFSENFTGIDARIIQHEVDHLNGQLMVDIFSPSDRMLKFMKLENIKKKNVVTSYQIK